MGLFGFLGHRTPGEYIERAQDHYVHGLVRQAIETYKDAIRHYPGETELHHRLAVIYLQLEASGMARDLMLEAVALNPRDADLYYTLGRACTALSRAGEAEDAFRRAIDLNPHLTLAYNNLSLLLAADQRVEEAIDLLLKATEMDPDLPMPWYHLGQFFTQQNRIGEAIEAYAHSLELDPHDALCCLNLAVLHSRFGNLELAKELNQRAIRHNRKLLPAYTNLARIYELEGDNLHARETYEKILQLNPGDEDARRHWSNLAA
ncbi:MAG: tetratricopeptide repeat protein [Candidatus Sericytochromatia bacterium]